MHFDNLPSLISSLAGSALGTFVVLVLVDNLLGVVNALKSHTFDAHKLPSFLASQLGTREAAAVAGAVAVAYLGQGDIRQVALAAVTAGGGALSLAVLADIIAKLKAFVADSGPAPAPPVPAPAK